MPCFISLHFITLQETQILHLFTNRVSVATLRWASLLVSFFQQHPLTLSLHFRNPRDISSLFIIILLLWWPEISNLWYDYFVVSGQREQPPYKTANLNGERSGVLTAPWRCCLPLSLTPPVPLYSLRYNNIEIRPINQPPMASKCSNERKSSMSSHFKSKARND